MPAFIDRTQEFFKIVEDKKQEVAFETSKKSTPKSKGKKQLQSAFYERAGNVSQELQNTADNLQKLTKCNKLFFLYFVVVKQRTPFDDNADHIHNLTLMVKEQLGKNSLVMKELKHLLQEQKDDQNAEQQQQKTKHSTTIVKALDSRLMFVADQFQSVLKSRTKQIKQQQERRNKFTFDSPNNLFNNRVIPKPHVQQNSAAGETTIQFGTSTTTTTTPDDDGMQLQQHQEPQQALVPMQDRYLQDRTDEIMDIEKNIVELSEMYKDFAVMVREQGELVMTVERNVEDAHFNVEQGQHELLKYLNRVSSNRGLILKIFFVLVAFIVFLAVFVLR